MENRTALITGAAGHLGRRLCEDLASEGVNLVLVDKNPGAVESFSEDIAGKFGTTNISLSVDLLRKDSFAEIEKAVSASFDSVDYVVNNAAFYDDCPGWGVPFEEEGYDAWMKVMQVNLLAPFFVCQSLYSLLQKSDVPSIVNVSSMYGAIAPDPSLYEGLNMTNPAAYAASKGGLIQMSKWMSTMLTAPIRVNSISPGGIERGHSEQFLERYNKRVPLGRMTTEAEVSRAIRFLLSEDSSYITGQNLMVDGGWTAW